jgi:hypothetical protein
MALRSWACSPNPPGAAAAAAAAEATCQPQLTSPVMLCCRVNACRVRDRYCAAALDPRCGRGPELHGAPNATGDTTLMRSTAAQFALSAELRLRERDGPALSHMQESACDASALPVDKG